MSKNLKIQYLNIDSIRTKLDELELFLANNEDIEIVALTETWLYPEEEKFFKLKYFDCFFESRPDKKGGGVAIFIKKHLKFALAMSSSANNCNYIFVDVFSIEPKLKIGVIYKPPQVKHTKLFELMDKLLDNCSNCILLGDININLLSN